MLIRAVAAATAAAAALTLKAKRREHKIAGVRVFVGHFPRGRMLPGGAVQ